MPTKSFTAFYSAPSNAGDDAPLPQSCSATGIIIAFVGVHFHRPEPRRAWPARTHLGNGIDDLFQSFAVVDVCSRQDNSERRSMPIYSDVALASELATVGWTRPDRLVSAPFLLASGAATDDESTEMRSQSMRRAASSLSSTAACSSCQTPASCQSRKRRQQVMPEPQFISCGSISQGKPVRSTNRMPVSAARSPTLRGRPPFGLGGDFGSSGSTTLQNSSVTISLAIMLRNLPKKASYVSGS